MMYLCVASMVLMLLQLWWLSSAVKRMSALPRLEDRVATLAHNVSFFFSSRSRHTRLTCDWSSDVCSSDLARGRGAPLDRDPTARVVAHAKPEVVASGAERAGDQSGDECGDEQEADQDADADPELDSAGDERSRVGLRGRQVRERILPGPTAKERTPPGKLA